MEIMKFSWGKILTVIFFAFSLRLLLLISPALSTETKVNKCSKIGTKIFEKCLLAMVNWFLENY